MKNLHPRHYVYSLLLFLVLVGYLGTIMLWWHQRREITALNSQVNQLTVNQAASQGPTYNDATIAPAEHAVYLPLVKLKLPDTALTEKLVYTYTDAYTVAGNKKVFPANLSISTHDLAANAVSTTQQFDCSEVVYADFVTPSYAVNPLWKSDGSLKLADGRTMHVYYAPSVPGCQTSWQMNTVDAKAIADALKTAVSY